MDFKTVSPKLIAIVVMAIVAVVSIVAITDSWLRCVAIPVLLIILGGIATAAFFGLRDRTLVLVYARESDQWVFDIASLFWRSINPIRARLGMTQVRQIPPNVPETDLVKRAANLYPDAIYSIRHGKRLDRSKRNQLRDKVEKVMDNMAEGLWKLARLRRVKSLIGSDYQDELQKISLAEAQLSDQMSKYLTSITQVLVSLQQVDVLADKDADKILRELTEVNRGMEDLIEGYQDVRALDNM